MDLIVPCYSYTDLVAAGLVHDRAIADAARTAHRDAVSAVLRGGESTSLEAPGTTLQYRLLDGVAVSTKLPWLTELYRGPLLRLASATAGRPMVVSPLR